MKIGILNDFKGQHVVAIKACQELNVDYEEIDIISSNWINNIKTSKCDGFLAKPPCRKDVWKRLYDERLYFINVLMGKPIYPSLNEIYLYENKRNMAYWLEINEIPAPKTWVFYDRGEALRFLEAYDDFPLIFKTNIGSAGIGVKILETKRHAKRIVNKTFTKLRFYNRGYTKWGKKWGIPYPLLDDRQFDNVLFQEKIDVKWEWRGVKIGESYFAHKKLEGTKGMHSGSGLANYDTPPLEVMDFIKYVCDLGQFNSMNVDFFEDKNGDYYVNELQTMFGSRIKPYQMCVDGEPGRYVYDNGSWVFEPGMFNQNNSFNLRVQDFVRILEQQKTEEKDTPLFGGEVQW